MSSPYIDQDTLDQCKEALRQGKKLDQLAGQLRCDPGHLANLLGEPQWRTADPAAAGDGVDLWSGEDQL